MTVRLDLTVEAPAAVVDDLVSAGVAGRIGSGDTTLWPGHARPGWVDAARAARPAGGEIEALRETFREAGIARVLVAGDVGAAASALAGDAPRLVVLDTPDPVRVADALAGDLETTVLVAVGSDPTTQAVTVAVQAAFIGEALDAGAHTVRVGTGPVAAGPAARSAAGPGGVVDPSGLVPDVGLLALPEDPPDTPAGVAAVVVPAPDDVDGPWAVLTTRALVPVGLAGGNVRALLADAAAARPGLVADDAANPALRLGALLAEAPSVALTGPGAVDWVAALLAGLGPTGPLPLTGDGDRGRAGAALTVRVDGTTPTGTADVVTSGPAAAQVLLWQHAVAVAAHLLGVDPTGPVPAAPEYTAPATTVDGVEVRGSGAPTLTDALRELTGSGGHVAVQVWLDRDTDASAAVLAEELGRRTGVTSTIGWAPAPVPGAGPVLLLTGGVDGSDVPLDSTDFTGLAALQRRLADAEAARLTADGRPVLVLHLHDRLAGLVAVAHAVQDL